MRLISCYIENFGGLSQYSITFQEGLTVIKEDNGFGKTTLAEFIRAMFYGFPRASKNLEKNSRKRYSPWQGGKYGGNIVFEHEGILYRMERFFGKVPRSDTFVLYELEPLRKSDRFTENIGVELFQLDSDSFERSTYMPQIHDLSSLTTASIQAKLGNLVEDVNDINNFDKAMEALRKKRISLIPYRGTGGTVAEAQRNLFQLQRELDEKIHLPEKLMNAKMEAETFEASRKEKQDALNLTQKEIASLSESMVEKVRYEQQYQGLQEQEKDTRAKIENLKRQYPAGFPLESDIENIVSVVEQIAVLSAPKVLSQTEMDAEETVRRLKEQFQEGIPTDEELERCQKLYDDYIAAKSTLQNLKASFYENNKESSITYLDASFAEEAATQSRIHVQKNSQTNVEKDSKNSAHRMPSVIFGFLFGIVAILAGIGLFFSQQYGIGAIALVVGVVSLVIAVYLRLTQMISSKMETHHEESKRMETIESLNKKREMEQQISRTENQLNIQENSISDFLKPYYPMVTSEKFGSYLFALQRESDAYRRAQIQVFERKKQEDMILEELQGYQEQLNSFAKRYQLNWSKAERERSDVQKLRDDVRTYTELSNRLSNEKKATERFYQENEAMLTYPACQVKKNLDELKIKEETLRKEIQELHQKMLYQEQEIRVLQRQADEQPRQQDELERWAERKQADTASCELLDKTMTFMQEAKDALNHSYLTKIHEQFDYYINQIAKDQYHGEVLIDPDLEVHMERYGETRELAYFSVGQADVVMLCMRLALVDALFSDVSPFIILDDPFVNLDDTRMEEVKRLLSNLCHKHQIIYMVCNSSRLIEEKKG